MAAYTVSSSSETLMARTASLSSRSSRPRRSSRSSSSVRSRARAARSAKTSTRRSSSGPSGDCGGREEIASTPSVRPAAVRTGQEMNDEARYQSQARRAVSGSSSSSRRSRRALAPSHCSKSPRSSDSPRSIAASVTPGRSRSYGRWRTGVIASRASSLANQAAAGRITPASKSTTWNAQPLTSSRRRICPTISSSVCRSHVGASATARPYLHALRLTMDRARRGGSGALSLAIRSSEAESPLEGQVCGVSTPTAASMARGSRAASVCESGQVRKEAALSGSRRAQRESPVPEPLEAQALVELLRRRVHGPLSASGEGAPGGVRPDGPEARRGRRDARVDVARVEDVLPRDALARRHHVGAAARPLLLGDGDLGRVDVEPQREQRHRAVVGHRDRRAREARREGVQVVLDPVLDAQGIAQVGDAVDLGRDEDHEAEKRQRPGPRPPASPRVPARPPPPAEGARSPEDREDRRRTEQVAAEDRQPRGGQGAEGDDRDHAGDGAHGDARSQEHEREHPTAGRAEKHGLAQDLAQPAGHGTRNLAEARDAL